MSCSDGDRLDTWKEIAAYLNRDVRTVRRWELERKLPIHRVPGGGRRAVFAFRKEIEDWLETTEGQPDQNQISIFQKQQAHQSVCSESQPEPLDAEAGLPSFVNLPGTKRLPGPRANLRFFAMFAVLALAASIAIALVPRLRSQRSPQLTEANWSPPDIKSEKGPVIVSVTPIAPEPKQRIVIQGHGFGLHVPYANTDSPYLAIRDQTAQWAAGRIIPQNWDEVMLDVESWTDTQIVVSGFSGSYGPNGWKLNAADELEVAVWNPQSGSGPALYHTVVISTAARR